MSRSIRGSFRPYVFLYFLAGVCFALPVIASITDPSALISVIIDDDELPEDIEPEHANEFAFEGGTTGTADDPGENINQGNLQGGSLGTFFDHELRASKMPKSAM